MKRHGMLVMVIGAVIFLSSAVGGLAQETQTPNSPSTRSLNQDRNSQPAPVDADVLKSRIAEVEATTTLDEQVAGTLLDLYRRALTNLERARVEMAAADVFVTAGANAPEELAGVRRAMDARERATAADSLPIPANVLLSDLEQTLTDEKSALADAEARLAGLRETYALELARPGKVRARLDEAHKEHDATLTELNSSAPIGESVEITEARRWHLATRSYRLGAEIDKLDQELITHAARFELLEAKQDQVAYTVERARTRTRRLEDGINERRGIEAEQARQEAVAARHEVEGRHIVIRDLARGNVELSSRLTQRILDVQSASNDRNTAREEATRIKDELSSTQNKLAIAGLNQTLGQVLIEHRRELPDLRTLKRQAKERDRQVATVGLEQMQLAEQRRDLRDIDSFLSGLTADLSAEEADGLRDELQTLAVSRRELVQKSIEAGARYLRVLGEMDLAQRQLMDAVQDYDDFLGRWLLWVRNTTPINVDVLGSMPGDIERFLSPSNWSQLVRDFVTALRAKPIVGAFLVVLLVLGVMRRRFLAQVDAVAKNVGHIGTDSFKYTLEALAFTAIAAVPFPLILIVIGSMITSDFATNPFSDAVAASMVTVGTDLLILQFFFDVCRDDGLAIKHCRWPASAVDKLRDGLRWFKIAFPALRFVGRTSFLLDTGTFVGGLAVLFLVAATASLAAFVFRMLTPSGGVLREFLVNRSDSLTARSRPFWFGMLTIILPALTVLWLAGYNHTASVLAISFMHSIWLVLGLVVLQSLVARWLLLGYQRLELKAATERREAARAAQEMGGKKGVAEDAELEVEEPETDFAALGSDVRRLLRTIVMFAAFLGLWLIWLPIIPALGVLEDITLWTRASVVNGESVRVAVTLADLLVTVVVGIATGAAASDLPSFVEFLLLQRTSVTTGARYTATTLLRYVIIGVGTVLVFGMLGGNWSQIRWLVAALGVGIGFGLQEIVANFISGLIILFERPLRIGDVVTVGDTSGVVTRIKIRATTIRGWDRRELLVPNREFITNRLLNWTFSDSVMRVVIPVDIVYGSDVVKAMKLTEEAARENDVVLQDPPPFVTFEDFGDSSIKLLLRAYIPSPDRRLGIASDLRASLKRKFEEAGIVIAFPQRDVHLDTSKPLEIRMKPSDMPGRDPAE